MYEFVVHDRSGNWQHWRENVPKWVYPKAHGSRAHPRYSQLVVPTLDTVRYQHVMALAHAAGKPALVSYCTDWGAGLGLQAAAFPCPTGAWQ